MKGKTGQGWHSHGYVSNCEHAEWQGSDKSLATVCDCLCLLVVVVVGGGWWLPVTACASVGSDRLLVVGCGCLCRQVEDNEQPSARSVHTNPQLRVIYTAVSHKSGVVARHPIVLDPFVICKVFPDRLLAVAGSRSSGLCERSPIPRASARPTMAVLRYLLRPMNE